eukprot:CAMPEP_0197025836 /NCGR_PEP_ID=MMETSP1384-20130603/6055_1 /TAXON_ID=29189 /ORGANISM="Ammonia sp." /LENGTH=111 /DNA_ID=CAMNT_0042454413 /DNA_START=258 /DNA_END=590 /DNA_ORIENTATION=+
MRHLIRIGFACVFQIRVWYFGVSIFVYSDVHGKSVRLSKYLETPMMNSGVNYSGEIGRGAAVFAFGDAHVVLAQCERIVVEIGMKTLRLKEEEQHPMVDYLRMHVVEPKRA